MTTIAYDGKTISCDGLVAGEWIESTRFKKIFKNVGKYKFVGVSGCYQRIDYFIRWLSQENLDWDNQPIGEYSALIIDKENNIYDADMSKGFQFKFKITAKCTAIGSGSKFALGSMCAGKTSREAVKIAKKLDVNTGGKIRTYKI